MFHVTSHFICFIWECTQPWMVRTIWLYRPSTLTYSLKGLRLQLAYFCWSLKLNSASALAVVHPEQTHDPCPPIACNSKGSQPGNIHSDSKRPSVLQGESNFSKFINERIVQPGPGAIKAWSWCQSMPRPGANQCLVLVPINAWSWCQSRPSSYSQAHAAAAICACHTSSDPTHLSLSTFLVTPPSQEEKESGDQ